MTEEGAETTEQRDAFLDGEADAYWHRNLGAEPVPDHLIRAITHGLPGSGSLLEVGCSDGRLLRRVGDRLGPDWTLTGIDPSAGAIAALREERPDIEAVVASADAIPFQGPFDAVILGFMMYVVDRPLLFRVAAEVDRVLTSGMPSRPGRLFIIDFDPVRPTTADYRHLEGLRSWKMDYSRVFLGNPDYHLVARHHAFDLGPERDDRVGLWCLERVAGSGYEDAVGR